jgi:2-keto-4-pentenoate hydratase/2-oxohepta-3-ene-1,7-dioic acid hydratase in catechol pathway
MPKIARFRSSNYEGYGLVEGDSIYELDSPWSGVRGREHPAGGVRLLNPCAPTKIVCVGRNYRDHAKELGNEVPAEPLIFLKPPSSLLAAGEAIVYPELSQNVNYEGELGVIVGKRARRVSAADARNYIFGYTCVNDVTARDLQRKDGQWTRGKGFDTFCPAGPYIVGKDDVNFDDLRVRTLLDGEVKQDASVRDMIFPVDAIIAFVTQFMTLEPGDLIATGTPAGVGPMQPGSTITVEIAGVGKLENRIVAAAQAATSRKRGNRK